MAISSKTRKTLWARSGNSCAMCRTELVAERNEHNRNLNVGDECHIISEQLTGPRHIPKYDKGYDNYDNLILLCKNHHKTVDELKETYTIELLKSIKRNHENWIKTVIDNAKNKSRRNDPRFLPRLTTGKQIVDIVRAACAFEFDHDEFKSEEEADIVSEFLQEVHDFGEILDVIDLDIGKQVHFGYELNEKIDELEEQGFFVFGERKRSKMTNSNKVDLGIWDIATIIVLRDDNPKIINFENILGMNNEVST